MTGKVIVKAAEASARQGPDDDDSGSRFFRPRLVHADAADGRTAPRRHDEAERFRRADAAAHGWRL